MTAASVEGFPATDNSVLSPVLIGLQIDHDPTDLLAIAWHATLQSMPITRPTLNTLVQDGRRTVTQTVVATRSLQSAKSDRHPQIVRLCDSYKGQSSDDSWKRWRWSVGGCVVPDKQLTTLLPTARSGIRIDVLKFRLTGGRVDNAAELALFRHYVVSGLRAIDPAAEVIGGQHDWDNDWWRVPSA